MNTLIINLTRFGDLLQTQPVISGLTARGHRVSLVCLENFAPATAMLRHVEAVYPLPGARLLSLMESGWHGGLSELWQWSRTVRSNAAPRTVLNLTASLSVRLLARHLTGADAQLHGFALDSEGFGHNTDPWSTFLQASTRMRGCSPFNIIDLFRMSAGLDGTQCPFELNSPADSVREAMNSTLQAHTGNLLRSGAMRHPPRGFVALQPGASEERRRWPVEHFARTGDMLWQSHGLCPVLLGSGAEAELGRRYAAAATAPHINLIGATDLPSHWGPRCWQRGCSSATTPAQCILRPGWGCPFWPSFWPQPNRGTRAPTKKVCAVWNRTCPATPALSTAGARMNTSAAGTYSRPQCTP